MNKAKIQDIAPHIRLASTELRRDVFNRTYLSFILIMMFFMALMGFTVSQNYETQKDLVELKNKMELQIVYINKLTKEVSK